jgi:hypothetical protein
MSEFLNSLNAPDNAPQSWAAEVAAAEAAEAPAPAPEPVAEEPAPEPAPVAEAAPEPPAPAPEATEEVDRRVPLKALQEERQKRAELERRLAELEQRTKAPEPEAPADPDPETDPIGALKAAKAELRRMAEETQRQQYEAQLNNIAFNAATQFQQQAPDYRDAYQYALKSRAQELKAIGPPPEFQGTQEEYVAEFIPKILKIEEFNLVARAVANRRNPAEAIYEFAKARGYARPAPAAPAPAPAVPDPALQQAKKAVAASASAGGAPAAKGEISDADAVNLKGAAFDAYWNKKFGGNRNSMFRE